MLNAQFRPLDKWPGERTKYRKEAIFRATYQQTLDCLERELSKLNARAGSTIIQVDNLHLSDIRNDGWPRGSWCPRGGNQGVIVSFESPKGAMSFPCDRYTNWQDNLRAIALSLEALRTVDRYGVTRGNEQYRGWARLEAPNGNGKMDRKSALRFISELVRCDVSALEQSPSLMEAMIKRAKVLNHPDHVTGDAERSRRHEVFVKIGQAEEVLCGR